MMITVFRLVDRT